MKKALLILSLIVFAAACDKHDDDYKKKMPSTYDYIKNMYPNSAFRQADHFVQGYMSVSSVKIDRNIKTFRSSFQLRFSLDGDIVKGGNMKGDPCDEGFEQLAQKYDDVYGPQDVLCVRDMDNGVIMTADKMQYYVYLVKEDTLLISDIEYDFYTRRHKEPVQRWTSPYDPNVKVNWDRTMLMDARLFLEEFNDSKFEYVDARLISTDKHFMLVTLPKEAGVYSLRFVAKKDGKVIHDEIIEDLELPAFEYPFPVLMSVL